MNSIKNQIKILMIEKNMTMKHLVEIMNKKYNRNDSIQNFNNKLTKGTIRYYEIIEIAEALDYDMVWLPKSLREEVDMHPYVHFHDHIINELHTGNNSDDKKEPLK